MTTLYELEREAWRLGRDGNRREIERFIATSYTHEMIMSGRIKTRRHLEPEPMNRGSPILLIALLILVLVPVADWMGWLSGL